MHAVGAPLPELASRLTTVLVNPLARALLARDVEAIRGSTVRVVDAGPPDGIPSVKLA